MSAVAVRDEVGSVDSSKYFSWANLFVENISGSTSKERKFSLYEEYRSHMTLHILEFFGSNKIEVYTLAANRLGHTQPCESLLFSQFKSGMNQLLHVEASEEKLGKNGC